ncbi:tyrosine-type recombinase/integrase [Streptomyces sp. NPDC058457]|uniref:tyrosine-type recombinase/integrase n=1 Tax=Streptomyces sp. NPDC058457 TaxID=3346507 RepID=UPI0036640AC3
MIRQLKRRRTTPPSRSRPTPPLEASIVAPRTPERGRLYRRCGCRRPDGRQFGAACPNSRVERAGLYADEELTLAAYLTDWLRTKEETLKPTTCVRYRDYVRADLIPSFGRIALQNLRPRHITAWQEAEFARARGRTTIYRIGATLSSSPGAAVRARLIADNPCRHAMTPGPTAQERTCWNPTQAAAFLRHNHTHCGDQSADLFELLLGTGMRRGEALGLHWTDVHRSEKTLLMRWNLAAVNNDRLYLGHPKTKAGRNWVSLFPRVAAALERRATLARAGQPPATTLEGLVFCQPDGCPLRPQGVLTELRRRSEEIGLPRIRVHDLRHTAATIMISSRSALAVVSKTLRHSTLSTTVNLYGHLLPHAARDAITTIDKAPTRADRQHQQTAPASENRAA